MKAIKFAVVVFGMLFSLQGFAEQAEPQSNDVSYQVKRADTLSKLSKKMLDKPGRWRDVARYNKLPDANKIEIKQEIKFQQAWLKNVAPIVKQGRATVLAISGVAKLNGKPVLVGDQLLAGAKLETAERSALRFRLPDGSIVNLMQRTQLRVEKLEQGEGDSLDTKLRLLTGHIEGFKKKYEVGHRLSVQTRTATMGVRGTHFRARQVNDKSFSEIEEGLVNVEADKTPQPLTLASAQGAVVDGKNPAEVVPLLPAPTFPSLPVTFATPYIEWALAEQQGAKSYEGELAEDEEFSKNIHSVKFPDGKISFTDLPKGNYWLHLRAVDERGLQGMEAKINFSVDVRPRLMAMIKAYVEREVVQLHWMGEGKTDSFQVQVAANQEFTQPILDTETSENSAEFPRPVSGRYFVRVRGISSDRHADEWDAPVKFVVP